jgi:membrane-anchored glycerophosphoryl diester phosphodiesterase (GDPDase)
MNPEQRDNPKFQSDFYRDSFHKLLILVILEVFVIVGLLLAITWFILFQPGSHFYATTTGGNILPLSSSK